MRLVYHLADGRTLMERQDIQDLDAQEALKRLVRVMVTVHGLAPAVAIQEEGTGRHRLILTANLVDIEVDPEDQEEPAPGPNVGHFD